MTGELVTSYRGMNPGHPVKVKDLRGRFLFHSAQLVEGRAVWVAVTYDRGSGRMGTRIVIPERVIKRRVREAVA